MLALLIEHKHKYYNMNVDNTSNSINIIYTKIILSYIKKLKSYHDIGNPHDISHSHSSQCHLTLNPYVA